MALDGFGTRLKTIRQERGYTQKQLAGFLGVTEQAVSKYERGSSYPDIGVLSGIAEVLDCSLDYLFQLEPGKRNLPNQENVFRKQEINRFLQQEVIILQFNEKLVPLFMEEVKQNYPHMIELRQQAALQWGVILPIIRLRDQLGMEPFQFEICIHGVSVYSEIREGTYPEGLVYMLGKLKEVVFQKLDQVLNNQCVYYMVENLRQEYPYVVESIVPKVISYSRLRQVLIHLIRDFGYTANPLILIIQLLEQQLALEQGLLSEQQSVSGLRFGAEGQAAPEQQGLEQQSALHRAGGIPGSRELARRIAEQMDPGFRLENWVK